MDFLQDRPGATERWAIVVLGMCRSGTSAIIRVCNLLGAALPDVNLALLQHDNPFCEGKSELKYFEPALVNVPTMAAATPPFMKAIKRGATGCFARTRDEWRASLQLLVDDSELRSRVGRRTRFHAIARFGPDAQPAAARRVFLAVAGGRRCQ